MWVGDQDYTAQLTCLHFKHIVVLGDTTAGNLISFFFNFQIYKLVLAQSLSSSHFKETTALTLLGQKTDSDAKEN